MSDDIQCAVLKGPDARAAVALFERVFTASEGAGEGKLIEKLATELIHDTPQEDVMGCVAKRDNKMVGCILFSRFTVPGDKRVFLLSPVAVETQSQGTGIGQQLIRFGLAHLRKRKADIVVTYGDPNYYGKTGFLPITEAVIQAPLPLSMPFGWQAQSLDGQPVQPVQGKTRCVAAFDNPALW